MFICPVCGNLLQKEEKAYTCPKGHNYDLAKEGYVYLLPPNKKHSKDPGDNKQMVAARRAFLETGLYQPFSDELDRLALECLGENRSPVVLDAGCGEGYYTGRLAQALGERARVFGFDISKCAVRAAAKRYREIAFAVGSQIESRIILDSFCGRCGRPGGERLRADCPRRAGARGQTGRPLDFSGAGGKASLWIERDFV